MKYTRVLTQSLNLTPEEWYDGCFPYQGRRLANDRYDIERKKQAYGRTPFRCLAEPGAMFFYVNGDKTDVITDTTGAIMTWDPNNAPPMYDYEATDKLRDESSQLHLCSL